MNYELLFKDLRDRRIRIALTGANGGFGRTFIAQCRAANVGLAVLCDRDVQALHATLLEMGYSPDALRVCNGPADVLLGPLHVRDDGVLPNATDLAVRRLQPVLDLLCETT